MMLRLLLAILVGTLGGFLGGALGLGGAAFMLPGLLLLGIVKDYKTAVGTILLTILPPSTLLAVIDYYKRDKIDVKIAVLLFISSFLAAYGGAIINKKLNESTLEYIASFLFFLISVYYFYIARNGRI
jgi:uncharacterized membrane protein YfcA